jgi:glycosyltransferase involved in cell wall biosynthesis
LVRALRIVRPEWEIIELAPAIDLIDRNQPNLMIGLQKYYERYWRYPLTLRLQDVDLFHIIDHSDGYLSYWLKRYSKPNVVTCHDLINLVEPATFKGRSHFPLVSMTAWRLAIQGMSAASHIITVSSHTKKDTVHHLQIEPKDITVIPNGVDPKFRLISNEIVHAFRQRQRIAPDTFCLLNVGSNNARKNISTILEVVAVLQGENFPIHFWKVGADFNEEQKRFIQKHNLDSYVTYLGQPDEDSLITIYNAADALMAPSLYEGFGLTILEAMACGTVAIAANTTSLPEVAGDAAIFVEPTDVKAIAATVRYLYTDSSYRQELVCKGLERVKSFTWESTAQQVASIYEKVFSHSTL